MKRINSKPVSLHNQSQSSGSEQHINADIVNPKDTDIAIVGLDCWYPGASNANEFWENIVARRREFRQFISERLPLSDYHDPDPQAADKVYASKAAYIDGFEFDWSKWRIPKQTYEATDIAQWLALDITAKALADAGYDKQTVPRDRTGAIVGNTLTGEQTRAFTMRLRWPYVLRSLQKAADGQGIPPLVAEALAATMEDIYKSSFPEVNEDTLQGGLSNTIAGRICNYFDLHGGGYTVDGACSSSLLSVCTAANYLANRDWDMAIAGGVDISLDTFELVGFAKTAALSPDNMYVYDERARGFLPGEGCGFVVLKRLADARRDNDKVYAVIRGWGISSDGKGGITAPNSDGQSAALIRAYERAGYSPKELHFIEGHGTGTPRGDKTELQGVAKTLNHFGATEDRLCGMTSLKSIVGHTKAAAGIGALIKTAIAVNQRVIPPTAGCMKPNPVFENEAQGLYPVLSGEKRPVDETIRAGVSAMGFGGINSHITLESGDRPYEHLSPGVDERALFVSNQQSEVYPLSSDTITSLRNKLPELALVAQQISLGEMVDLAAEMASNVNHDAAVKAVIIATEPQDLADKLNDLHLYLSDHSITLGQQVELQRGDIRLGMVDTPDRIAFLLPGQGSQQLNMGRVLVERYDWAQDLLDRVDTIVAKQLGRNLSSILFKSTERATNQSQLDDWQTQLTQTEIAQPAICFTSLLYATHLKNLGISATILGGHSLGEITALHLAGMISENELFDIAVKRGMLMGDSAHANKTGSMAALACDYEQALTILEQVNGYVTIANINSPRQVVISGDANAISDVVRIAKSNNISATALKVSSAFHSEYMSVAAEKLKQMSAGININSEIVTPVISGVTAQPLKSDMTLNDYLANQCLKPVDFIGMSKQIRNHCDWAIEVGPGRVLSNLTGDIFPERNFVCFPIASAPTHDTDINHVIGRAFVAGHNIQWSELYQRRLVRSFVPKSQKQFIVNPCEKLDATPSTSDDVTSRSGSDNNKLIAESLSSEFDNLQIEKYLQHRKNFIADVIKADMRSATQPTNVQPLDSIDCNSHESTVMQHNNTVVADSTATKLTQAENSDPIEATLAQLILERTGYPKDSFDQQAKLLDDLNLDSIKASELIAELAKQFQVAGQIEPAQYSNATLAEIVLGVRGLMNDSTTVENNTVEAKVAIKPDAASASSIEQILIDLVANISGYSVEHIQLTDRLLDDLNLDSIKAAELIAQAAKSTNVAGQIEPASLANASIKEIALQLAQQQPVTIPQQTSASSPDAIPDWVRNYKIELQAQPLSQHTPENEYWCDKKVLILFSEQDDTATPKLTDRLNQLGADVNYMQIDVTDAELNKHQQFDYIIGIFSPVVSDKLLAQQEFERVVRSIHNFVAIVSDHKPHWISLITYNHSTEIEAIPVESYYSAFARSLLLENPRLNVSVLSLHANISNQLAAEIVTQELAQEFDQFKEVIYEDEHTRMLPRAELVSAEFSTSRSIAWSEEDVILVTGGGKGITAECALALSYTGAKFALVGSSPLNSDKPTPSSSEINTTLQRFKQAGSQANYYSCDITNESAVAQLVNTIKLELGPVSGVIHGAGSNMPNRAERVEFSAALTETSPKVIGAINLITALKASPPKLFASLTSIIGVTGMDGNAWYALANETLNKIMGQLSRLNPNTQVLSVAYSVWAEIGMGQRLGVIEQLRKKGIGAISTLQGVQRFAELVKGNPHTQQVIVTAALGDLPTWRDLAPKPQPQSNDRFTQQIVACEPGVSITARTRLNLKQDSYLADHNYRGSLLFPTVFGMEAMSQVSATLLKCEVSDICRFEQIKLERPIVVDPERGQEIEITALAEEIADHDQEKRVHVSVRCESTGYAKDHFSAIVVIGERAEAARRDPIDTTALQVNPKTELYGSLLFQGSLFQNIEHIYQLSDNFVSLSATENAEHLRHSYTLHNPFVADALLQSLQFPCAPNIYLPIKIDRWEFFNVATVRSQERFISANSEFIDKNTCRGDVMSYLPDGTALEKISGYWAKKVEDREGSPGGSDLASLWAPDVSINLSRLKERLESKNIVFPTVVLMHTPNIHSLQRKERHEIEKPIVAKALRRYYDKSVDQALRFELRWNVNGKPMLVETPTNVGISISHDDNYCMCVIGEPDQGCDIIPMLPRSNIDWTELLGPTLAKIFYQLTEQGVDPDNAGSRVLAAFESAQKISGESQINLVLDAIEDPVITFAVNLAETSYFIATDIEFFPDDQKKPYIIAIAGKHSSISTASHRLNDSSNTEFLNSSESTELYRFDEVLQRPVFEHVFRTTFKDSARLDRRVIFTSYLSWKGKLRELAMMEIGVKLAEQIATGEWGLVTNSTELNIYGEAQCYDIIKGRFWVDEVIDSTFTIKSEFLRLNEDNTWSTIAIVQQDTTWVKIIEHGKVVPAILPDYLNNYFKKTYKDAPIRSEQYLPQTVFLQPGTTIAENPKPPQARTILHDELFNTSLEDSNLVGNLYYANYFTWQGRVMDYYLHQISPAYFQGVGKYGEWSCLKSRMDYLRDAMPFDRIKVIMSIKSLCSEGAVFEFLYFRQLNDGHMEKLAVGQQTAAWIKRSDKGEPIESPLPSELQLALIKAIESMKIAIPL